mmetsp:Transcript_30468/g.65917  ORF Transcript_30468/g.65917 Transcript_30468/m.65917 type:complete len:707 (+) Transcript_30468:323-2443(+)
MLQQLRMHLPAHHLTTALSAVGGIIVLSASIFLIQYRSAAKRKLREVTANVPPLLLMTRVKLTDEQRGLTTPGERKDGCRSASTSKSRDEPAQTGENAAAPYMAHNLNLAKEYVQKMRSTGGDGGIEVMSLGEYLSSLRPAGPTKAASAKDVELLLGAALLKLLGPSVGTALLPVLGVLPGAVKAAAGLGGVAVAATAVGTSQTDEEKRKDKGGKTIGEHIAVDPVAAIVRAVGGLSILAAAGAADMASAVARARSGWDGRSEPDQQIATNGAEDEDNKTKISKDPLVIMRRGETNPSTFPSKLIPNPFIMSSHWEAAIHGLEDIAIAERGEDPETYDPDEHAVGKPTPVRDKLLPDLHIGVGGIKCTHTNREILENRLLSIVLNKLATIDVLSELSDEEGNRPAKPFVVKMESGGKAIYRPDELIQALLDNGHQVNACATTRVTTFGLRLSIKEDVEDEANGKTTKWTHIPLGFDLRTGLQHPQTGRNISAFITHGAIDLTVRGPLIRNVMLQYYHNQEGFDGWSSGHYPDADWCSRAVGSRNIDDPVRAVRLAGLLSSSENSVGSRLRLPLGGYGLTGCCTDSAAAIEYALSGSTGIYPLLGIGAYKSHVVKRADKLHSSAKHQRDTKRSDGRNDVPTPSSEVVLDAAALRDALRNLPNDVHPLPSTEANTASRILASCVPEDSPQFQLMKEEREILEEIASGM